MLFVNVMCQLQALIGACMQTSLYLRMHTSPAWASVCPAVTFMCLHVLCAHGINHLLISDQACIVFLDQRWGPCKV